MKSNAAEQQTIRQYLLGQLPSEEQSQFEERLLTDDDVFAELEIVEDELVDEYLRAELTDADRQSFESHFMAAAEHQQKLSFARAFRKSLTNRVGWPDQAPSPAQPAERVGEASGTVAPAVPAPGRKKSWFPFFGIQNPALGYAMSAVLVLTVVGVSWVGWRRATAPRDPGRVLSVALTSGLTRDVSEGPRKIPVTADTDTLRLQLIIPENPYPSYEATLVDAAGVELTTKSKLAKEAVDAQRVVIFDVPANLVPPGDYRVKLIGATADGNTAPVASYSFRIAE
ncbi:MAG: hypothetical protein WAM70_14480 [Pyrinomonadaceae bacterium]